MLRLCWIYRIIAQVSDYLCNATQSSYIIYENSKASGLNKKNYQYLQLNNDGYYYYKKGYWIMCFDSSYTFLENVACQLKGQLKFEGQ